MHPSKTETIARIRRNFHLLTHMPGISGYVISILILSVALTITGCSSTPAKQITRDDAAVFGKPDKQTRTQTAISKHYFSWKGTPYELGGLSKSGIDCSGFVHVTFRDIFKKKIPRTTELLAKSGKHITKKALKFGDLVFFKTSRRVRHVGIYIDNGKFIHASSSRGVMTSSLNSSYWSQRYWKAQRMK
ncbi:MAG: C40 family peptidase [Ectothiorhodospiraceae bacterium]|nr:C40 family peptidase [Ectothiorhodospiraceae bacterium]